MDLPEVLDWCGIAPATPAARAISRAWRLAHRIHAGQTRSDGRPAWDHVLGVVETLVCEVGECTPVAVTAAVLHDVVEAGGVASEEVTEAFGPAVGRLVAALTKPAGDPDAGSEGYLQQVAAAGPLAVRLKICDRVDGLRGVAGRPPAALARFVAQTREQYVPWTRWHAPELLALLEPALAQAGREG